MKRLNFILLVIVTMSACQSEKNWEKRIGSLKGLDSIKTASLKFSQEIAGNEGEVITLGNDTSVAPLYYKIKLYPSLNSNKIAEIEKAHNISVPETYKMFLTQTNGAFLFGISLYGFPSTWLEEGLGNRQNLEPLNLFFANMDWKSEMDVEQSYFLFGGSEYSDTENIYYFIHENRIFSLLENGTKVNEWDSIDEMLASELQRLEK